MRFLSNSFQIQEKHEKLVYLKLKVLLLVPTLMVNPEFFFKNLLKKIRTLEI
jgi:hypothetical protein